MSEYTGPCLENNEPEILAEARRLLNRWRFGYFPDTADGARVAVLADVAENAIFDFLNTYQHYGPGGLAQSQLHVEREAV